MESFPELPLAGNGEPQPQGSEGLHACQRAKETKTSRQRLTLTGREPKFADPFIDVNIHGRCKDVSCPRQNFHLVPPRSAP